MAKKKASDYYNNSAPFLGRKVSFAQAYPNIEKLVVEVNEYVDFWKKNDGFYPYTKVLTEKSFSEYVNCHSSSCDGGGFNINNILHEIVENSETAAKDTVNCIGHIKSQRCTHTFEYSIKVTYKENAKT